MSDVWLSGMGSPRLEVREVSCSYELRRGPLGGARELVRAVNGVSLFVAEGESLALVGESGSGKTTLARALVRLIEPTAGEVWWRDAHGTRVDLLAARGRVLRALRRELGIVFQDPQASLNPRLRVGAALAEPLAAHGLCPRPELSARVEDLLARVGLDAELAGRLPHELSGGQRQRVALARVLALEPRMIVCDEIVSALDVSVQAQILDLLDDLQAELGLSILFVAHDLGVVRHAADRVAVMFAGHLVEVGRTEEVFCEPAHAYTRALLASMPGLDPAGPRRAPPSPPHGGWFDPEQVPVRFSATHVALAGG